LFSASPSEADMSHPHFSFRNLSSGGSDYRYEFGDPEASTSDQESPTFTYRDSGTYEVKLVVSNDAGCVDSTIIKVVVRGLETFYLPTAFTPNQDGLNELFMPKYNGQSPLGYEMRIFNRWGEEIFFSNQWEKGWDGYYMGKKVPAEIYICKIRFFSRTGKASDLISSVTVTE
jgi:gliding motility-associated-like protein